MPCHAIMPVLSCHLPPVIGHRSPAVIAAACLLAVASPKAAAGQCLANELFLIPRPAQRLSLSNDVAMIYRWVYRIDGSEWTEEAELTPFGDTSIPFFGSGLAVSVNGDVAVVGMAAEDNPEGLNHGAVYIFRFNGTQWIGEARLTTTADDGLHPWQYVYLGASVSISGDVVVIGAYNDISPVTISRAYVFRFDGTDWIEEAQLTALDGMPGNGFGWRVSTDGQVAVVGAPNGGPTGHIGDGAAYIFRFSGSDEWVEEAKLISDPRPGQQDHLGASVSLSGDAVLVGTSIQSFAKPVPAGAAYVFRFDPDACEGPGCSPWLMEQKLVPADAVGGDRFGGAVSLSGNVAVIGAVGDYTAPDPCTANPPTGGLCNAGSAYVYVFDGNQWDERAKVTSSGIQEGDYFGAEVAVRDDTALIGQETGSKAFVFRGLSDCNDNGLLDLCDITDGSGADDNGNGVLDECELPDCPADLDANGTVGILDLLALLAAWGSDPGGPPDFDFDGTVGILDLLTLLANWGPCA